METFLELKNILSRKSYTWLITGIAGFIGSNLMEELLKLNQKVIGLDNFSTGYQKNIDDVLHNLTPSQRSNFLLFNGDICNYEDCQKSLKDVDIVLHQAALGSVPRSIATPEVTNKNNVTGFLNMITASKEANIKRFVYASSSAVYGDSPVLPKLESHVGNPLSPYAVSKYTNELYAKSFTNCYGIETVGLRYFNVFGPRQDPTGPYAAVIPLWILSLLKNEPIYINGDGETSRDFCYVKNVVQANIMAGLIDNKEALNRVYNVTVGEQTTLNQLFKKISSYLSSTCLPIHRDFRSGDIRHSLADISLIKKFFGYEPLCNVERGLELTIDWLSSNTNQYN